MASAVMGASAAEVDCSGLCGCVIPMLAVKAVIFCGGVFCTRRFRALQDSRPLQFVKKSTKFYRLSNRRLYALNDNVDVLKELGHLHENKPLFSSSDLCRSTPSNNWARQLTGHFNVRTTVRSSTRETAWIIPHARAEVIASIRCQHLTASVRSHQKKSKL